METLFYYLLYFGILSILSLLAILLFKKRWIKKVRTTYFFTPITLVVVVLVNYLFFYTEPEQPFCGFPYIINSTIILFLSTFLSMPIQLLLNRLFKVEGGGD